MEKNLGSALITKANEYTSLPKFIERLQTLGILKPLASLIKKVKIEEEGVFSNNSTASHSLDKPSMIVKNNLTLMMKLLSIEFLHNTS